MRDDKLFKLLVLKGLVMIVAVLYKVPYPRMSINLYTEQVEKWLDMEGE